MLKSPAERLTAVLLAWIGAASTTAIMTMLGMLSYFVFLLVTGVPDASAEPLEMLRGIPYALLLALIAGVFAMFYALVTFGIGLTVFTVPMWWALHRLKLTNPIAFALTGAGLSVAGGMFIGTAFIPLTPLLAIPGGVAGWMIWLLGYTRTQAASEAST